MNKIANFFSFCRGWIYSQAIQEFASDLLDHQSFCKLMSKTQISNFILFPKKDMDFLARRQCSSRRQPFLTAKRTKIAIIFHFELSYTKKQYFTMNKTQKIRSINVIHHVISAMILKHNNVKISRNHSWSNRPIQYNPPPRPLHITFYFPVPYK